MQFNYTQKQTQFLVNLKLYTNLLRIVHSFVLLKYHGSIINSFATSNYIDHYFRIYETKVLLNC